ncbi:hypothetical protein JNW89_25210 [Micromonospora sp. 4G55]|nr:hypothetical protein [Micromonospora sp. 4G55]
MRKQQGRVDLDADWNEQQDIQAHLRATALTDLVGPAGAPLTNGAFALTGGGGDLKLSAGRYYLDGVLCENDAQVSVFAQPDLPAAGPFVRKLDGTWLAAGAPSPPGSTWPGSRPGRSTSPPSRTPACARWPWAARTPPPGCAPSGRSGWCRPARRAPRWGAPTPRPAGRS